jgi:hypothetical protein
MLNSQLLFFAKFIFHCGLWLGWKLRYKTTASIDAVCMDLYNPSISMSLCGLFKRALKNRPRPRPESHNRLWRPHTQVCYRAEDSEDANQAV